MKQWSKAWGPRLKSAAAYLGGTLLPEGRVALVLNPGYLIDAAAHHPRQDLKRAPPEKRILPAHQRRGLVVDDSEIPRALGKHILQQAGFEVEVAANGQEALSLWKKLGAEVIVADVEMPVIDGLALTRAIRAAAGNEVRIVLVSANDTPEARATAIAAGADAYLIKGSSLKSQLTAIVNSRP